MSAINNLRTAIVDVLSEDMDMIGEPNHTTAKVIAAFNDYIDRSGHEFRGIKPIEVK